MVKIERENFTSCQIQEKKWRGKLQQRETKTPGVRKNWTPRERNRNTRRERHTHNRREEEGGWRGSTHGVLDVAVDLSLHAQN